MKILTVHNRYKLRGGEDETRDVEDHLFRSHGHEVINYDADNGRISGLSAISTAIGTPWNYFSYRKLKQVMERERPALINVHNFFPLISPSVFCAANELGIPIVQTLHNFRLLCPGSTFFREGRVCEECLGRTVPWPSVAHGCYRGSRPATAPVAAMLGLHNVLHTWSKRNITFVALTDFARRKFIAGGIPAKKLAVRSICLRSDLGPGSGDGDFILYVGRLVAEKGLSILLRAWQAALPPGRLLVAGEGPLGSMVEEAARETPSIDYLGRLPLMTDVYDLMGRAKALVFPSLWYEGMPRTIVESLCRGTPVIASGLGSMREMIQHNRNGWLVAPGDCQELGRAMKSVLEGCYDLPAMRAHARAAFELKYQAASTYKDILNIFDQTIQCPM